MALVNGARIVYVWARPVRIVAMGVLFYGYFCFFFRHVLLLQFVTIPSTVVLLCLVVPLRHTRFVAFLKGVGHAGRRDTYTHSHTHAARGPEVKMLL